MEKYEDVRSASAKIPPGGGGRRNPFRRARRGLRRAVAVGTAAALGAVGLAVAVPTAAHAADGDCTPSGANNVCTFTVVGSHTWTVPSGVTQARFELDGARGGGLDGGQGGILFATLPLTPGASLQINVGGPGGRPTFDSPLSHGGWNGGGAGTPLYSGGGGGATDIRTGAYQLANRVLVAGGGGGGGGDSLGTSGDVPCNGGSGSGGNGATAGRSGGELCSFAAGGGATQQAGGTSGGNATAGGQLYGGTGNPGGGGGGGYFGGGGGSIATQDLEASLGGGGGGSGYAAPQATDVQAWIGGVSTASGKVVITYATPWQQLSAGGYNITSAPAVSNRGVNGSYVRDIFALTSSDTRLIHQMTTFDGSAVGTLESLGHPASTGLLGTPAAVSWGSSADRVDVFARGMDNALWHISYTTSGGWSSWDSLGGTLACDPTVASWGTDRLDVFTCDTSNHLAHKYWNGSSWSGWEGGATLADYGQTLTSAPSAVSWGSGRIDVFARDANNNLIQKVYDSGAGGWQNYSQNGWYNLGGSLTSAPTASSQASASLDIYARNSSNTLSHLEYRTATGWAWVSTPNTVDSPNNTPVGTASTSYSGYNFMVIRDNSDGWKFIYGLR